MADIFFKDLLCLISEGKENDFKELTNNITEDRKSFKEQSSSFINESSDLDYLNYLNKLAKLFNSKVSEEPDPVYLFDRVVK